MVISLCNKYRARQAYTSSAFWPDSGNTVTIPAFTGGGRSQEPLHALYQARAGTEVEPSIFSKLAGQLPHMKEFKLPSGIQTYSRESQVIQSQLPLLLSHMCHLMMQDINQRIYINICTSSQQGVGKDVTWPCSSHNKNRK